MRDEDKTTEQLRNEIARLQQRVARLETAETEHKWIQNALQQSERKYRRLIEKSVVGVYLVQEDVFRYVNPRMAQIFGYDVDDLMNTRGPKDVVFHEDWPLVEENLHKRMTGVVEALGFQFRGVRGNGDVIYVEVYGSRTDYDGQPAVIGTLLDITSAKSSEEALRASEERFRALYEESKRREELYLSLLNSSADAIVIYDMDGNAQYVNGSFTRIFGWSLAELAGRRIPFLPDSEREASMEVIRTIIEDGTPCSAFETRRLTKDGRLVDVSISASRCHDHQGAPAGMLVVLCDITHRKQVEEALRQSEDRYRHLYEESRGREELYVSLLNSSPDAIVIYDMEGRVQYVSSSFTRTFGWTMEELVGQRVPFLPESEREATMDIISRLIRDGTPCSGFETKRYTKDGRVLDISISASRNRDHEGRPVGTLAILRDISDGKKAEAALRESEERFRTLAEVAPLGLVIVAPDERTEYVNPKFTEIFGYTIEDLPDANTWFEKSYPSERSKIAAEAVWKAETSDIKREYGIGKEARPRVFAVRCKDDRVKMTSFRAVVLATGRLIATFLDVTAEVESQEKILRAKNEWERTFDAVSDLIMILDAESRIARVNKAMAERLGKLPDAVVGMSCDRVAHDDEKSTAPFCPDVSVLALNKEYSTEVADEALGGVFDLKVSPLHDDNGRLIGSVNVARDITAFKSMDRARRRAIHHLAHELKTPLAVIKSSVKNLTDKDLSEEARATRLARIQRNLRRLSDIQRTVQEIVAPRQYRPVPFEVTSDVCEILEEIRTGSAHREVGLVSRLESVHTDLIDPEAFRDVLTALVKNAVENTPDEGDVVVYLAPVPEGILLQVEDRGMGIKASDREFVFNAFYHTQATSRYSTRNPYDFNAGGKGLELMRVKILSEEGSFHISFDSTRCRHIRDGVYDCPGRISLCSAVQDVEGCRSSGGTTFSVLFRDRRSRETLR